MRKMKSEKSSISLLSIPGTGKGHPVDVSFLHVIKSILHRFSFGFYDVADPKQSGYNDIYWGVNEGIISGFKGVYFGPELKCTREQFAIMLWRSQGKPAASGTLPFKDTASLSKSSTSYKAILWAVNKGIIRGFSADNTFRKDNNVTREQIVIMLWKLAGQPAATKPLAFADTKNLSKTSTSYKAIAWASEAKIVRGFTADNTFRKDDDSKRNQIIIMIHRHVDYIH